MNRQASNSRGSNSGMNMNTPGISSLNKNSAMNVPKYGSMSNNNLNNSGSNGGGQLMNAFSVPKYGSGGGIGGGIGTLNSYNRSNFGGPNDNTPTNNN